MGGGMTIEEAVELAAGIREEWAVLCSLLEEAEDRQAWLAAGFDRPHDWLGDLPVLPGLALRVGEVTLAPVTANQHQARVSRPGAKRDVRPGRRPL